MRPISPFLLLAALVTMPMFAEAASPIGETALRMNVVDAKTGKPVDGPFVAASESHYWSGFHSSGTACFRAASKKLLSPTDAVKLPSVDIATSAKVTGDTRHIQLVVYRPGYCAAKPYASASSAGFIKWANKNDPNGLWGSVDSLKPGDSPTIRLTPASDPAEHRLRHLVEVAKALDSTCRDLPTAYRDAIIPAMLNEASALASTPVERVLVTRVNDTLMHTEPRRRMFAPYHGPAASGDVARLRLLMDWAKTDPLFTSSYHEPGTNSSTSFMWTPEMLPLEPGFGINSRNEQGFTPLMDAVNAMQIPTTRLLLESGADINVLSGPGGHSALDLVLARARIDVKEIGTEGFEFQLMRFIDMLVAAKPAPTIHPRYRDELENTADWKLTPHLAQFWKQVRERVAKLKPRDPITLTCPIEQATRNSLELANSNPDRR